MSELKIKENIIIDDVAAVVERIEERTGFRNIDIKDIIDFINHEPNTIYYVDEKGNVKLEPENTRYLWIDSGFEEEGKPIFISLLSSYGEYIGHYTGHYKFLTRTITDYYPQNTKYVNDNIRKFEQKYEIKIQNRIVKHLTEKYENLNGALPENFAGYEIKEEPELIEEKKEMTTSFFNKDSFTSSELGQTVREQLLVDKWKSQVGFERYIKIIGSRIYQLVEQGKTEYYVINKTKSVIVNTGLINKYGEDIKLMYRINLTSNTYNVYQLIESKQDYLQNDFTKEQSQTEIKPISFFDEGRFFNAKIDDFDINTRSLMHIIGERRDRFPDNVSDMTDDKLAQRIKDALLLGLKMQERDNTYVKPSYSGDYNGIYWLMPLHINNEFTDDPELVLVVSKLHDFYEIKTVLPYDDCMKDRIMALSLYEKLW